LQLKAVQAWDSTHAMKLQSSHGNVNQESQMLRYWIECVSSLFFRCYSIVNVYFALPGHVKVHGSVKLSPEVASTVATCGRQGERKHGGNIKRLDYTPAK